MDRKLTLEVKIIKSKDIKCLKKIIIVRTIFMIVHMASESHLTPINVSKKCFCDNKYLRIFGQILKLFFLYQ